jgi:hypothetical protein
MTDEKRTSPLTPPAKREESRSNGKIERALEVRKSSSKAREGKPLAFPTQRHRP